MPANRLIAYVIGWNTDPAHADLVRRAAPLLTHINYAFALIDDEGRAVPGQPEADLEHRYPGVPEEPDGLAGNFALLRRVKAEHPHLQTFISIGGWGGSGRFSDVAATAAGRERFVASAIETFLLRWPGVFDGIDVDWEYPVRDGLPENAYRPEDRRNCTLLFAEFRRQLDDLGAQTGRHHPLTAALPAGRDLPLGTFEVGEIARILDWINVMTYDISGSAASGLTNFNAALRAAPEDPRGDTDTRFQNVEGTVRAFREAGVPADRLVIGMPFYGRGYTGVAPEADGVFQPFETVISARYHEIAREYLPSFERHWHPAAGVPWLWSPERRVMMSYDDPASLAGKAAYIRQEGLGGAMFWELSGDDHDVSLLRALADGLRGT
jgi:chitinase